MPFLRLRILLVAFLLMSSVAFLSVNVDAQDQVLSSPVVLDAYQELEALLRNHERLSANFTQDVIEPDGYVLDSYSGAIKLEYPNQIYWRVEPPLNQILVANGETIYLHDPDLFQVTIRPWSNDPAINPGVLLAGELDIGDYYDVVKTSEGSFVLTTLSEGNVISHIELIFVDQTPYQFSINDTLGQTTRMTFENVDLSPEFSSETFQFDIPEGVELVYSE